MGPCKAGKDKDSGETCRGFLNRSALCTLSLHLCQQGFSAALRHDRMVFEYNPQGDISSHWSHLGADISSPDQSPADGTC